MKRFLHIDIPGWQGVLAHVIFGLTLVLLVTLLDVTMTWFF